MMASSELTDTGVNFIWCGSKCKPWVIDLAQELASTLLPWRNFTPRLVHEFSETPVFWSYLGNPVHPRLAYDAHAPSVAAARLWEATASTGVFTMNERRFQFCQDDLPDAGGALLDPHDGGEVVYVWTGASCSAVVENMLMATAGEYVRRLASTLRVVRVVHVVKGSEPGSFTRVFPGWAVSKFLAVDLHRELQKKKLNLIGALELAPEIPLPVPAQSPLSVPGPVPKSDVSSMAPRLSIGALKRRSSGAPGYTGSPLPPRSSPSLTPAGLNSVINTPEITSSPGALPTPETLDFPLRRDSSAARKNRRNALIGEREWNATGVTNTTTLGSPVVPTSTAGNSTNPFLMRSPLVDSNAETKGDILFEFEC